MRKKEGQLFYVGIYLCQWIIDIASLLVAMQLAYSIRVLEVFMPLIYGKPAINVYWRAYLWIAILFTVLNSSIKFFHHSFLSTAKINFAWIFLLIRKSIIIMLLCLFGFLLIGFILKSQSNYSRVILAYFSALSVMLIIINRLLLVGLTNFFKLRNLVQVHNVLIIGVNDLGSRVLNKIEKNLLNYKVVGFVEVENAFRTNKNIANTAASKKEIDGKKVLGGISDLAFILQKHHIKQVFIAIQWKRYPVLMRVMKVLRSHSVSVTLVPDIYQYEMLLNIHAENLEDMPIISLTTNPIQGWHLIAKRVFDIVFSFTFLIIFSPIYLFLFLLLWVVYGGKSIFYTQERMGLDQKMFNIIKFRTMHLNSEVKTGPVWAKPNEQRTTPMGKWLRKLSLDELPQFFNVLIGHMSVVGPRPERPHFIEEFKHTLPKYMLRHKVKTGVTGWAQINGLRGNTSLQKRIEYDLYYITNWSLLFDVKIIIRTVFIVLFDKNAY